MVARKSKKEEKPISTVESNNKYRFLILPGKPSSIVVVLPLLFL